MGLLLREPQNALGHDVALDLRGARRDRVRQRVELVLDEQPAAGLREVAHRERAATEDTDRDIAEPLAYLGEPELEDRRTHPGNTVVRRLGDVAFDERPKRI